MLLGVHVACGGGHALGQLGQVAVHGLLLGVVHALDVDRCEAGEALLLAVEVEPRAALCVDVHGQGVVLRGSHLAGDEAVVDQFVQPVLIP